MATSREKVTLNKGRGTGGIICLALALLLAIITFVLPAD